MGSDYYVETVGPNTLSCAITLGDGRIHDHFKGWGTVSSDGTIITWDSYRLPTAEEIEIQTKAFAEARARASDPAHIKWFNDWFGMQLAKHGWTRESWGKTLTDAILSVQPLNKPSDGQ